MDNDKRNIYYAPATEVIEVKVESVVCTSPGEGGGGGGFDGEDG